MTDPKGTILVECGKMLQRGTPKDVYKRQGRAARFDRSVAGVLLLCAFGLRVQSLWAAMPLLAAYGVLALSLIHI